MQDVRPCRHASGEDTMNATSKIVRMVFRRENILVVFLVIGALLGVIGVPQSLGVTSDQILLALLAVLAVDMLIERLGYLERIETNIAKIESKIEVRVSADNLFLTRDELGSPLSWLQEWGEMWVSGKDLIEFITRYAGEVEQAAIKNRKRFRFLIIDPDNPTVISTVAASSKLRPNAPAREIMVRQALTYLESITSKTPTGAIEVRLANWVPTNSYVIVDGRREHGRMVVEMFGYKIASSERLHVTLTRVADSQTFAYHLKQFESMWQEAKPLPTSPASGKGVLS